MTILSDKEPIFIYIFVIKEGNVTTCSLPLPFIFPYYLKQTNEFFCYKTFSNIFLFNRGSLIK